ncbi:bifunctional riboflavin kinase/FMN adenylyltransferase [Brachybacterium phenoliresistens]|uniref:bifunctional riboflavin kinase/FMN adenylyltransferase n=1 Tax=Brachybacterium phenoliresistens TaxID=396014 RepID=UPI0031E1D77E
MTRAPLWHSLEEVPADLGATAVTIGNFDGVHLGHRAVLERLRAAAEQRGLRPVALTFWPHPRHVMGDPASTPLITAHEDRDRLLLGTGIAGVLDLAFTGEFAQHSADDFVRIFLVEGLGMRCVVMGADSRFGRANEGDLTTMRELADRYGFDVVLVEDQGHEELTGTSPEQVGPDGIAEIGGAQVRRDRVSSSEIRTALLDGDVGTAASMLGRFHTVADVVHHGFKRGRELGFPTANLGPVPRGLVPADGVYTGLLSVIEQAPEHRGTPPLSRAAATISIGTNPTFPSEDGIAPRMVEAYVHGDHDLDLYGDLVVLEFVARQRPTVTFETVEALVEQMERDKDVTRRTLASLPGLDGPRP